MKKQEKQLQKKKNECYFHWQHTMTKSSHLHIQKAESWAMIIPRVGGGALKKKACAT